MLKVKIHQSKGEAYDEPALRGRMFINIEDCLKDEREIPSFIKQEMCEGSYIYKGCD